MFNKLLLCDFSSHGQCFRLSWLWKANWSCSLWNHGAHPSISLIDSLTCLMRKYTDTGEKRNSLFNSVWVHQKATGQAKSELVNNFSGRWGCEIDLWDWSVSSGHHCGACFSPLRGWWDSRRKFCLWVGRYVHHNVRRICIACEGAFSVSCPFGRLLRLEWSSRVQYRGLAWESHESEGDIGSINEDINHE